MASSKYRNLADTRVQLSTLLAILLIEALLAGLLLFISPSMDRNVLTLGMSARRLLMISVWLALTTFLAVVTLISYRRASSSKLIQGVYRWLENDTVLITALLLLFSIGWGCMILIVVSISPLSRYSGVLQITFDRAWPILIWCFLASIESFVFLVANYHDRALRNPDYVRPAVVAASFLLAFISGSMVHYMVFYSSLHFKFPGLRPSIFPIYLAAIAFASVAAISWRTPRHFSRDERIARFSSTLALFFGSLFVLVLSSMLVEQFYTPSKAYFHLLAEAILDARLFLIDPPSVHDLVPFEGRLYVAHPPLAALLMIPWVLLAGSESVNTVLFSAILAASTISLVYLLLQGMIDRRWITARPTDAIWLSVLFGFGTSLWWISTSGEFWFLSQISSLAFLGLAALVALFNWPAWLAGGCLGLAMLARPTVFTFWPFIIGIAAEIQRRNEGNLSVGPIARWTGISAVGIIAGILVLFAYNWGRFGNVFDTGFTRQNIAEWLFFDDLRDYGIFHPHFFVRNLRVLLLGVPAQNADCLLGLNPKIGGMSVLITTPTLLYLFRSWRRTPWAIGGWIAIGLSLLVLMMYHSTGVSQFGYRYMLDLMVPAIALLSIAAEVSKPTIMRGSIVISVVFGAIGVAWWAGAWCG